MGPVCIMSNFTSEASSTNFECRKSNEVFYINRSEYIILGILLLIK